jgi:hypothetical protein
MIAITTNGLQTETLEEIRANIFARLTASWGASVTTIDQSRIGALVTIVADLLLQYDQLFQALFNAQNPGTAVGGALQNLAALTGTLPLGPIASTAKLLLTGSPGTVPFGKLAESATQVFAIDDDCVLLPLIAWAPGTTIAKGLRRTTGTKCYQCIVAGVTGATAPTAISGVIVDGGVSWQFLGNGTAVGEINATATSVSETTALSTTISIIKTPSAGWAGVINLLDAVPGRGVESEESLRLRRFDDLVRVGSHSLDALRADLLAYLATVSTVYSATILQNIGEVTDVNGLPPHSYEAIVRGGEDLQVATLLLASQGAGDTTFGNTPITVIDSEGYGQLIKFTRPAINLIYATVDVVVTSGAPIDIAQQIKVAIVNYGDKQAVGRDVSASAVSAQCFLPTVLDVSSVKIGLIASPSSSATLVMGLRDLAEFDTSRIVVNTIVGTP